MCIRDRAALGQTQTPSGNHSGAHTLAMPLAVGGRVIGSLVLCAVYDAAPLTLRDAALARAIADQLSIAIENATLYDQVQQSGKVRGLSLIHILPRRLRSWRSGRAQPRS